MQFEKDHIYHIYNQGNNRQKIFFDRENYLFFLQKMNDYLLPYCDIMAWCLMPNHFHWMVYVREIIVEIPTENNLKASVSVFSEGVTPSETADLGIFSEGVTPSDTLTKNTLTKNTQRTLNDSIGLLLRSYTRAINKQENMSGSLFRKQFKAECLTQINGITPSFYNTSKATIINVHDPQKEYPQACFNYIHQNPVKAGLVKLPEDWEFSSFRDICGLRNGKLISKKRIDEFGLISSRGATLNRTPTMTESKSGRD